MGCTFLRIISSCQVKIGVSHHTLADGNVQSDKQLVFVLDHRSLEEGETKKRKKNADGTKRKNGPSFKNFGAYLQPSKIKASSKLIIGWRARQMFNAFLFTVERTLFHSFKML